MFPYIWKISDWYPAKWIEKNWLKVFSCFACGGGSTMWYKLAWFDVIWCNEIDPKMNACYVENHQPEFNYLEDIRTFKTRNDLPEELYNLDILDWSPPCSSFSMAGNREDDRGKEKKFREWQELQTLDDLFFDFIDLAKKLQPKVVIAENVKWLLMWEARGYVQRIYKEFDAAWYYVEHYLLDSSDMWVPQRRERVFFVAVRKDQTKMTQSKDMFNQWPKLKLAFDNIPIFYEEIEEKEAPEEHIFPMLMKYLPLAKEWQCLSKIHPKWSLFNYNKAHRKEVLPTITAHINWGGTYHYETLRPLTKLENILAWSFPLDYNFLDVKPKYIIWMSVPPVMTAQVAYQIYLQLFT